MSILLKVSQTIEKEETFPNSFYQIHTLKTIGRLWKKLKIIQINGKVSHVHGLEDLILLKYPYYPKQSTDLMQSCQNTRDIFHRTRINEPKICMEPQKSWIAKAVLRKKEQSWRHSAPWLQNILWSYSNQNSVVLTQKKTH